jgi:hypothetical protein
MAAGQRTAYGFANTEQAGAGERVRRKKKAEE